MPGDDAYDELFSAPVEDFVARRDALVKQLKAEGDKEQAAVVKSWRRPSRVVGALNRLALTDDGATADFVDAARALGSTRGTELREANEQFRAAVKHVAARGGRRARRRTTIGPRRGDGCAPDARLGRGRALELPGGAAARPARRRSGWLRLRARGRSGRGAAGETETGHHQEADGGRPGGRARRATAPGRADATRGGGRRGSHRGAEGERGGGGGPRAGRGGDTAARRSPGGADQRGGRGGGRHR